MSQILQTSHCRLRMRNFDCLATLRAIPSLAAQIRKQKVAITAPLPLARAAKAHQRLATRNTLGTIVLRIQKP
jgi:hypothetical protein